VAVELTRKIRFCSAHRLYNPNLSEEENRRVFGACANPHGHGHTYALEISIHGEPDPKTGMIVNIDELDAVIRKEIVDCVDHRHLNYDVPFLEGVNPTMENMVVLFWKILADKIPAGTLSRIRLWESDNNSVTYTGA